MEFLINGQKIVVTKIFEGLRMSNPASPITFTVYSTQYDDDTLVTYAHRCAMLAPLPTMRERVSRTDPVIFEPPTKSDFYGSRRKEW